MHDNYSIGKKFGRLVILSYEGKAKFSKTLVKCLCDCGEIITKELPDVRNGHTKSCGCLRKEATAKNKTGNRFKLKNKERLTHGKTYTPEFYVWSSIKVRCMNPHSKAFKNYGGRGITVCDKWLHSFEAFLGDLGERPSPKHQIDRIDNDGNYCPENCRWSLVVENNNNKRTSKLITFNNRTLSRAEWEREIGLSRGMIRSRLIVGWTIEKILTTPKLNSSKYKKRGQS